MSRSIDYREKYLDLLEEHESFEKQSKYQLDMMRAVIYKLGSAASGLDNHIDAHFTRLKHTMRGGKGSDAVAQMERLQNAITEFETHRNVEHTRVATSLKSVIDQYQQLNIPITLSRELKNFSATLAEKLSGFRHYSDAMIEIGELQKQALQAALRPDLSLWERLFNKRTLEKKTGEKELTQAGSEASADFTRKNNDDTSTSFADSMKARIIQTLHNLITEIDATPKLDDKISQLKAKLTQNISDEDLAIAFEDIRDILFMRYLKVDEEFSQYLAQVKGALASIRQALGQAQDHNNQQRKAAENLSNAVFSQVDSIQHSLHTSEDLSLLKQEVAEHISYIRDALENYKNSQPVQNSLTEQLKSLVDRVKNIEEESEKAKAQLEEQKHKATHDALTGLPNREAYNERGELEWQRLKRYEQPLTLAICDIDHFKKINDTYGHPAGDKILQLVAKFIASRLREVDFVSRYGGEEFVVLMPNTVTSDAVKVLDKIRKAISEAPIRFKEQPIAVTLCFGLAQCSAEYSIQENFEKADKALYEAKGAGRNRCIIFESN